MSFQDIIKNSILETMENNTLSTASICITLGIAILFCIYIYAVYYLSQKRAFTTSSSTSCSASCPS